MCVCVCVYTIILKSRSQHGFPRLFFSLTPFVTIVHRFWQVCQATSFVHTDLM